MKDPDALLLMLQLSDPDYVKSETQKQKRPEFVKQLFDAFTDGTKFVSVPSVARRFDMRSRDVRVFTLREHNEVDTGYFDSSTERVVAASVSFSCDVDVRQEATRIQRELSRTDLNVIIARSAISAPLIWVTPIPEIFVETAHVFSPNMEVATFEIMGKVTATPLSQELQTARNAFADEQIRPRCITKLLRDKNIFPTASQGKVTTSTLRPTDTLSKGHYDPVNAAIVVPLDGNRASAICLTREAGAAITETEGLVAVVLSDRRYFIIITKNHELALAHIKVLLPDHYGANVEYVQADTLIAAYESARTFLPEPRIDVPSMVENLQQIGPNSMYNKNQAYPHRYTSYTDTHEKAVAFSFLQDTTSESAIAEIQARLDAQSFGQAYLVTDAYRRKDIFVSGDGNLFTNRAACDFFDISSDVTVSTPRRNVITAHQRAEVWANVNTDIQRNTMKRLASLVEATVGFFYVSVSATTTRFNTSPDDDALIPACIVCPYDTIRFSQERDALARRIQVNELGYMYEIVKKVNKWRLNAAHICTPIPPDVFIPNAAAFGVPYGAKIVLVDGDDAPS